MSLTEILSMPEVAEEFERYVELPEAYESISARMISVPRHSSYGLVGTAFDYCLRFVLAAANPGRVVEQMWIAEIALEVLASEPCLPAGLCAKQARKGVARARELYDEFLETRVFTRRLARAALFLAALDRAYRTGPATVDVRCLKAALTTETDDLMCLVQSIPRDLTRAQSRVALNPDFGEASLLVGGADADFVIDDTLVDIKTTKYLKLAPMMLHQLVGYRILLSICEENGSTACGEPRVTHGAIYFSRHALLVRLRYDDMLPEDDLYELAAWFIETFAPSVEEAAMYMNRLSADLNLSPISDSW